MENNEKLDPIVSDDSEILILGSFPGLVSLREQMYYANRGNRFWPMISEFYSEEKPTTTDQKKKFLKKHKIALWDVYKSVVRQGSMDIKIEKGEPNRIDEFLKKHQTIDKIIVAGKKAQKDFEINNNGVEFIPVPSTSGRNAHFGEFEKNKWKKALGIE